MANEQLSCEVGEYHAQDGLFFKRMEDGAVRVRWPGGEQVMSPGMWTSAVANVSAVGETGTTWAAANALHDGKPSAPIMMSKSVDTLVVNAPMEVMGDMGKFRQFVELSHATLARSGYRAVVLPHGASATVLRGE